MRKYKESTPLEDRDEVAAFQAQRDKEESTPSAEKYEDELKKRNTPIYEAWCNLVNSIDAAIGQDYPVDGVEEFFADNPVGEDKPYLVQTGYYDSDSFHTEDFYYHDHAHGGVGVAVYYKDGEEAGGYVFDEFIPKLKKAGGAEISIAAGVAIVDKESQEEIAEAKTSEQMINLYAKYLIQKGDMSRKETSEMVRMLKGFIDGSAERNFPGAKRVNFYGIEAERPMIIVEYDVSVSPTDEEVDNIEKGLTELYDIVMYPRIH